MSEAPQPRNESIHKQLDDLAKEGLDLTVEDVLEWPAQATRTPQYITHSLKWHSPETECGLEYPYDMGAVCWGMKHATVVNCPNCTKAMAERQREAQ
jgi:hypothetical protein